MALYTFPQAPSPITSQSVQFQMIRTILLYPIIQQYFHMISRTIKTFRFVTKLYSLNRQVSQNLRFAFSDTKNIDRIKQESSLMQENTSKNSIMPKFQEGFAYGHHFPKDWSQQYIHKILDPSSRQVQKVTFVKTKVGQYNGKILIKFKNQKIRQKYIKRYNEDYIMTETESHRVVILPFQLKTQGQKRTNRQGLNFKNPVRISNLDFDITKQQLHKLAADYGQISHIDMYERQSGINRGFATVYFQRRIQANQFVKFLNGFKYRQRKLRAYTIENQVKVKEKQFLKVPSFTFKANQQLMKRFKSKQFQLSAQNK